MSLYNVKRKNIMIGDQKTKDDGYVSIATKVPASVAELLSILAQMRGMEVYELLQLLVNGFISYAKADTEVPEEFRHLYESLKFDAAWNNAYNFASPTAQQDIAQMILILQQPGRKGFGMMMVNKPFMSEAYQTMCIPEMVTRVLEIALGFRDFVSLRQMVVYHDASDVLDMIRKMIVAQGILDIEDSDRDELPGYGNHHDYGREVIYGNKHKRVPHRTPDSLANSQQTIQWTDDDRELAEYEAKGWEGEHIGEHVSPEDIDEALGCKPFDVEP